MATDQKQLIQRIDVRTMKKDIKRLREADVVKESQKIVLVTKIDKRERVYD